MISDLKLIKTKSGYFDISVKDGILEEVSGVSLKEQLIWLLVYSTWKPLIGYGVGIREFRGVKYFDLIKVVLGDRIARSVAFINTLYPEEARLGELNKWDIELISDKLKIYVDFGVLKIKVEE